MVSMFDLLSKLGSAFVAEKPVRRRKNAEHFRNSAIEQLDTRVLLSATYADDHVILSLQPNTDAGNVTRCRP